MNSLMKSDIIYVFYSKMQLEFKRQTEGSRFVPHYVIANGKKIQYTEKKRVNTPSFSDGVLVYRGSERGAKFL